MDAPTSHPWRYLRRYLRWAKKEAKPKNFLDYSHLLPAATKLGVGCVSVLRGGSGLGGSGPGGVVPPNFFDFFFDFFYFFGDPPTEAD